MIIDFFSFSKISDIPVHPVQGVHSHSEVSVLLIKGKGNKILIPSLYSSFHGKVLIKTKKKQNINENKDKLQNRNNYGK